MEYGPDFICIGAQKAGTSWLHWNLLYHPQTAMPPQKEINFIYPDLIELQKEKLPKWLAYSTLRYQFTRWIQARKNKDKISLIKWFRQYVTWYKHYEAAPRTLEEYVSLFPKYHGKVTGDISPAYADMPDFKISELARALPKTKIIYLLRNPIERAWSQFKMDYPQASTMQAQEILQLMQEQGGIYEHSYYSEKLDKWENYFPGQIKIWFYDQLCQNPKELYLEICNYLDIPPTTEFYVNKIQKKIFEGPLFSMPSCVREYLSEIFHSEINLLNLRFNNFYTQRWQELLKKPAGVSGCKLTF